MLKLIMDRKEKNCNKCGLVKNYKFFRKKNNKSGWKDIQGGLRYSYCKQCESDRMRLQYKIDPIPQMLSNSRIRAKKNSWEHNINTEYLRKIWPKDNICPVLRVKFLMGYKMGQSKNLAPSLDRIDSTKGYIYGNISVVSDIVNRVKSDVSMDLLEKIYDYYVRKQKK